MKKQEEHPDVKVVAKNKKATYLYSIEERIEAGIVLQGSEVKSLRAKNVDISDAYAAVKEGEVFLFQAHIAEYKDAGYGGHNPKRARKLLLHAQEIRRLRVKLVERGFTLVPLSIYFRKGKAKLLLGLARGKKKFDRRRAIKEKDMKKAMRREKY
jgi:SsrA-binding protein